MNKVHAHVTPLKAGHYKVLSDDLGGDAPKDFVQIYKYGSSPKIRSKRWEKHIAKVGHKWYPLESVTEYLLNRIGEVIGLEMAFSQLRLVKEQIRFLSKYFLKADERLMHGAEIYSGYLAENDNKFVQEIEDQNWSRALFTFQFTYEAVKFAFPKQHPTLMEALVKLLVFDAITGNNDRHFYNWGVITDIKERREPRFSPIYDSARGLFWNDSEATIQGKLFQGKGKSEKINQLALTKYMNSSRPKIGWDGWNDKDEINHFQLLEQVYRNYPKFGDVCRNLLNAVNLQSILTLLELEFKTFYTPRRFHLIQACIKQRFEMLQKLC